MEAPVKNKEEHLENAIYHTHSYEGAASVRVDDLLTVYPELAVEGETEGAFMDKVRRAAEVTRNEDAYVDLRSRLKEAVGNG